MAYDKFHDLWLNGSGGGTAITAEALNHIEGGIADAHADIATKADAAATTAALAAKADAAATTASLAAKADAAATTASLASKAADADVVHKTGAETIAGVKTFSSAPSVPNDAWTIAKTNGLQSALDGKAPTLALSNALGGSRFTVLLSGSDWLHPITGAVLAARPSARTDIYFDLIGGSTGAPANPAWLITGDAREYLS